MEGKKKTIIWVTLLLVVVVLGIGYAAISAISLNISGGASADPSQSNFVVKFSTDTAPETVGTVNASVTDDLTATMSVTGLTAKGDKASAKFTILNDSRDLSASLDATISKNTNNEYFNVTKSFESTSIGAGETTTITVEVELIKTPVDSEVSTEAEVKITASPVQP